MSKVLIPYTIVPSNLYVHRDADRQIKNIIQDMARPGYVLVSRQMGKTNLLLNAKRELEGIEDIFIYIDLSNTYGNAQECFESIIDTAIEANIQKLQKAKEIIEKTRDNKKSNNLPPHKQHVDELRIILQNIKGKLVIILDEIDALTKTAYSDQIFSQIRSIYFSRVNYPEFNNLTYILSGVIEPNEIIKDSRISPFNIGQKIFLNDFSRSEFNNFIVKAKLNLAEDITSRIYYWTNGNPRICWDVCSEIENIYGKKEINIELIDQIINKLFLVTFDKPPIDNIREIVKRERDVRNAIVEIEYNKGNEISDSIKNKLYLSGVINYSDNNIRIKNEIIRRALNLNWIKKIEEEEIGLTKLALEAIDKESYEEALKLFQKYLEKAPFDANVKDLYYYHTSLAAYKTSQFELAEKYLNESNFDIEDDNKWHFRKKHLTGLIQFHLNKIDECLQTFKEIIEYGKKDEIYARALLNYGAIILQTENANHYRDAIRIFEDTVNEENYDSTKLNEKDIEELKSIALYNLAQIYLMNNNPIYAKKYLLESLRLSQEKWKASILLSLIRINDVVEEKIEYLHELVSLIIENKIVAGDKDPDKPLKITLGDFREIFIYSIKYKEGILVDNLKDHLNILGNDIVNNYLELGINAFDINEKEIGAQILKELFENDTVFDLTVNNSIKTLSLKILSFMTNNMQYNLSYLEHLFHQDFNSEIDDTDFLILSNSLYDLYKKEMYVEALKWIEKAKRIMPKVSKKILINYLIIFNLELNIFIALKEDLKAYNEAIKIISFSQNEEISTSKSMLLGESGFDVVKQNAQQVIEKEVKKVEGSFHRNQKIQVQYLDGSIRTVKYKKMLEDFKNGKCLVVKQNNLDFLINRD